MKTLSPPLRNNGEQLAKMIQLVHNYTTLSLLYLFIFISYECLNKSHPNRHNTSQQVIIYCKIVK